MSSPRQFQERRHPESYELLPIRFHRFSDQRVLISNMVGEHLFVDEEEFIALMAGRLTDPRLLGRLRATHMIRLPDEQLPLELLSIKVRTRTAHLRNLTGLHIFVVTLRCDHTCHYCQVSRQNSSKMEFDMTAGDASRAVQIALKSPSPALKFEFQGGEPLLNLERIEQIVVEAKRANEQDPRLLEFVIATNLALIDSDVIDLAREHNLFFSTSLDGPESLHNSNRPRPGGDSHGRVIAGIRRIQRELGPDRVSALMTTNEAGLEVPEKIIDAYVDLDLHEVFLRAISPYGFALRTPERSRYEVERWLSFFERGLRYILELNYGGYRMTETLSSIVMTKVLSNRDPGYVDLRSPSGIGIGALVYNYNGDVYASDEGRMLAEMGDHTFRLGNVNTHTFEELLLSDALLDPLEESLSTSSPMCCDCAFEPYCGADPVFHHATQGNFTGHKPSSDFCRRNTGVFTHLLSLYEDDRDARRVLRSWIRP